MIAEGFFAHAKITFEITRSLEQCSVGVLSHWNDIILGVEHKCLENPSGSMCLSSLTGSLSCRPHRVL